jgi:Fe-Mn family superoxide dismutase
LRYLNRDFASIDNLKAQLLTEAKQMYGPGFVWLVSSSESYQFETKRTFSILRTYLAGSPFSGAHYRRQGMDMTGVGDRGYAQARFNPKDGHGLREGITPLLCVSTWEHSWLYDWTVAGKEQFLNAWWNKINWNRVETLARLEMFDSPRSPGSRY